jgi:hypothetical protein
MDKELQNFGDQSRESDLKIILGNAPSDEWVPRGSALGPNILYDRSRDEVTLLRHPKPVLPWQNVQFIIQGDMVKSESMSIYLPHFMVGVPYWLRIARMFAMHDFQSDEELIAEHILGNFVEPFLYYRLPSKGYSLVHGAAVSNGTGILFVGLSNVGKTTMALQMIREGWEFLGDDLVILNESGRLLSYPKRINVEMHHLEAYPELIQKIGSKMSPARRFFFNRYVKSSSEKFFETKFYRPSISEIFDDIKIADCCDLGAVVQLDRTERGDLGIQEIDTESCVKTITSNLFWEFNLQLYRTYQYRYCSSYPSDRFFLRQEEEHHNKIRRIIEKAVSNVRVFEIRVPTKFNSSEIHRSLNRFLSRI